MLGRPNESGTCSPSGSPGVGGPTTGAATAAARVGEAAVFGGQLPCGGHVRIHGKGGSVLLDDRGYVALVRLYLARTGYTRGAMFRASINGRGGPLSYSAAHNRWQRYCAAAGVDIPNCGTPTRPS
ncbi:hypothetical protein OHA40_28370 [Nocardia sp. NBC_00508]|uniref:hypothetical protein n=1 Tax=Nocardia sp. NBC_00508 TaxID=2975992 RepID=UPI002E816517|nr:hypothetical protein [Nocardia sp. NBC_00508]WUD65501.1 hypothetical protein OHA40_28370 [Nocardia sp. NBC_00508]